MYFNLYEKEVEIILKRERLITGILHKSELNNQIIVDDVVLNKEEIIGIEKISEFQKHIQNYLSYVKFERRLADNTYISYKNDLNKYYIYCKNQGINKVSLISKNLINTYLKELTIGGNSSKTIARKLTAIKNFHSFLYFTEVVDVDITSSIESPKLTKKLPKVLTVDEVNRLLNFIPETIFDYRDKAMLELMYATGLRVSELVELTVNDIDLENCIVRCMGKGKKERMIPIGEYVLDSMNIYLTKRTQLYLMKKDDHLFLNNHGTAMSRNSFYSMIKKRLNLSNISVDLSPHTLRHSFATHMIENGSDLRVVQELLGHSNINTTRIYTHISNHKIRSDYEKYHPRSKK